MSIKQIMEDIADGSYVPPQSELRRQLEHWISECSEPDSEDTWKQGYEAALTTLRIILNKTKG